MSSPLEITVGARVSAYLTSAEDYNKYRKKLNRTLAKLRYELGLVTRDTKNYKDKEKISTISASDYDTNDKYGDLILLTAERNLLYALEIKNLMEISGDQINSYKRLMISKIKKSLKLCQKLISIINNESSDLKKIEIFIYASLVQSLLSVTQKKWQISINALSIARVSLDFKLSRSQELLKSGDIDEEEFQFNKTLTNELFDSFIDPSLNLALSQSNSYYETTDLKSISRKHCHDNDLPYLSPVITLISKIDDSYVSDVSSSVNLIKSIQWRDHEANLYNDEISYKIMALNEDNWSQVHDPNQFDLLISKWTQILEIHENDLAKNHDDDDSEKVQDRAILLTYINYNLYFTTLKRDLLLINGIFKRIGQPLVSIAKKLELYRDVSRLYDSIISLIDALKNLPGVYNDDELSDSLDNLTKFFAGKKSLVIAHSFALKNQYPESLKIYHHVADSLKSSEDFYKVKTFPYSITDNEDYCKFVEKLNHDFANLHVFTQLYHQTNTSFVIENINAFPLHNSLKSIVNIDSVANIAPLLNKPVLFDVGFNYINYGSDSGSRASTPVPQTHDEDDKKRSGFFGIFGRS